MNVFQCPAVGYSVHSIVDWEKKYLTMVSSFKNQKINKQKEKKTTAMSHNISNLWFLKSQVTKHHIPAPCSTVCTVVVDS